MSLRWKIALALAGVAALAAALFGTATYRSTKARLLDEVDRSLVAFDAAVDDRRLGRDDLPDRGPLSGFDAQVVGPGGVVRQTTLETPLPVSPDDLDLVGVRGSRFSTVETESGSVRVRTIGLPRSIVQVGRSLEETERVLASLRVRTMLIGGLVTGLAAAAGLVIASGVTASLRRLTVAAEHVGSTGRLDVSVADGGRDEVGRLSAAFDDMMVALARSRDEQRRLVQDAGHELRTPLTSLRTNVDTLGRFPDMPVDARDAILDDLRAETDELASLVDEIVAVASGGDHDETDTSFDLADVVAETVERYERRSQRTVTLDASPSPVVARRSAVQRAVGCLVENALKFDESGGPIEVTVQSGEVSVADRGPGIPDGELAHVFDRFHRAESARTLPGSGLGLSIVREVALRHGGEAFARNRDDGGAVVGFRIGRLPPPVTGAAH